MKGPQSLFAHAFTIDPPNDSPARPQQRTAPMMRKRQLATLLLLLLFAVLLLLQIRSSDRPPSSYISRGKPARPAPPPSFPHHVSPDSHPALQLIDLAEKEVERITKGQSQTLEDAVAEYKRRYGIHPPPNFDKWYAFARDRGVQLIDEYDNIYHSLLLFWGLEPSVIRSRVQEALGFDNALMGFAIRGGNIVHTERPQAYKDMAEWQDHATSGMIKTFMEHLPDMDLAFNLHDEPRVIVPHDDLSRFVERATDETLPAAGLVATPRATWSTRPADLNDGRSFAEVRVTRFNRFAHQPTWTNSRISCAPISAARSLNDSAADDHPTYAFSELGLVANKTAFSDICNSPSLRTSFGFFDRPNAFDVVHDLLPIFSQSKVSSFQDILYPSPWYWAGKVSYTASQDHDWKDKESKLYWRGSTTGGFSRDGGWRRQHRQHIVGAVNRLDDATRVYANASGGSGGPPVLTDAKREAYADLFDVRFSHVGQCDPGDCDAQREFFQLAPEAKQRDAWRFRYLLDVDGNAYSGRFYAFLRSRSQVFKMAVFREWHEEWLRPWLHYVPLSLQGGEWVELLRFFDREEPGREAAEAIAQAGKEWAEKVLRNEDFEVWFFRLLLEYGRVVDDDREIIGFKV